MSGRIALVTGASRGLGAAIVRQLAERGLTVLAAAREPGRVPRAAGVEAVALDVGDDAGVAAAAAAVRQRHGRLDVLINNAGVLHDQGTAPSALDLDVLHRTLATNLDGVVRTTRAFLPLLRLGQGARIINQSSTWGSIASAAKAGPDPGGFAPAYQISKAALNLWSAALAAELRPAGIRVACTCPGWCATDLGSSAAPRSADQGAAIAVRLATDPDIASGVFLDDRGAVPW